VQFSQNREAHGSTRGAAFVRGRNDKPRRELPEFPVCFDAAVAPKRLGIFTLAFWTQPESAAYHNFLQGPALPYRSIKCRWWCYSALLNADRDIVTPNAAFYYRQHSDKISATAHLRRNSSWKLLPLSRNYSLTIPGLKGYVISKMGCLAAFDAAIADITFPLVAVRILRGACDVKREELRAKT
jgi:hypothetical protein